MRQLIALLLLFSACVHAGEDDDKVYRWVDAKGVVHYTDKSPAKDAKPIVLPKLQTIQPHKSSSSNPAAPTPKIPVAPQFSLAINSPTPDQYFRDTSAQVSVSVTILPGLVSGYGLYYSLDGKRQNDDPVDQTSYTLTEVFRGTHTISVSLVGPDDKELANSSVTVHLMPPIIKRP